jgi:hypothetical protein
MHAVAVVHLSIAWGGLFRVLWVGLIAGVGLVALFALGVRVLAARPRPGAVPAGRSWPQHVPLDVGAAGAMASLRGLPPDQATVARARPARHAIVLSATCFVLCAGIALYGLYLLIEG